MFTPYEIIWLFVFPAVLESWIHIFIEWRRFTKKIFSNKIDESVRLIFIISSKNCPELVQKTVDKIYQCCKEAKFSKDKYRITINCIEKKFSVQGAEIFIVPKEFKSKSKFKARQLDYMMTQLPYAKNIWYFHLDEDSLVTTQCIKSILDYASNKKSKPIANGAILYERGNNLFTFYAECHRHWNFYWLISQMRMSRAHWTNGSCLLVRSDIEHIVGWNYGNYISEDSRFAYESRKKLGKCFGWHGGLVLESPPKTFMDLLRQRRRWFFGSILNLPHVPIDQMPRRVYALVCWFLGFVLSVLFFAKLGGLFPSFTLWITIMLGINAIFWFGRYQIGLYRMLYRVKTIPIGKRILYHVGLVIATPFLELFCTLPTVYALIKPPKAFDVTGKQPQERGL